MNNLPEKTNTQKSENNDSPEAIDWSVLAKLKAFQKPNKPDLSKKLIEVYLISMPPLMANLNTAVIAEDSQSIKETAHSLKSSSLAIGAMAFGQTCLELEQFGKTNDWVAANSLLPRAKAEFATACLALEEAKNKGNSQITNK